MQHSNSYRVLGALSTGFLWLSIWLLRPCQTPRIPSRRLRQICNEAAEKGARRGWGLHQAPSHRRAFRRSGHQCRAPSKQSPQDKTPGGSKEQAAWTPTGLDTTGRPGLQRFSALPQSPNCPGTKAEGHSLSEANKYLRHCRSGNRALVKRLTT